jgi:oxalate decarboxylase family bicupin protein
LPTIRSVPLYLQDSSAYKSQREVLSKNFDLPLSAWDNIPPEALFIFPGTPAPTNISEQNVTGSAGIVPLANSYTYHLSEAPPTFEREGGTVKILDPTSFPIASGFSAAVVTVKPGAMREIHWHTTSDEWNFFLQGKARISVYAAVGNARTFDYNAGDCGYVREPCSLLIKADQYTPKQIPKSMSHYVENIGTEDVVFIEVLQADHFSGMLPPPFSSYF